MRVSRWIRWWVWVRGWSVRWGRGAYRNTCFSPLGGLKRSGTSGRRGSGEGLRRRAGLWRTRGTAATLAAEVFMMALGAFMVWLVSGVKGCRSHGVGDGLRSGAKTFYIPRLRCQTCSWVAGHVKVGCHESIEYPFMIVTLFLSEDHLIEAMSKSDSSNLHPVWTICMHHLVSCRTAFTILCFPLPTTMP